MPPDAREAADRALVAAAVEIAAGSATVATYAPMPGEPAGAALVDALAAVVGTLLLPVLLPDLDLDWAPSEPGAAPSEPCAAPYEPGAGACPRPERGTSTSLRRGPGAGADTGASLRREPAGATLGIDAIAAAQVVLVPAVAVDRTGIRLGRGGGSYDRALARVSPATPVVALVYGPEFVDRLPREPHDRRVTAVLLPDGLRPLPR